MRKVFTAIAGLLVALDSAIGPSILVAQAIDQTTVTDSTPRRKPGLEIALKGPDSQYAGAKGQYIISVHNTGNLRSQNIHFLVNLPSEMDYLGGIRGAQVDAKEGKVQWVLTNLGPKTGEHFYLNCRFKTKGALPVEVRATSEDGQLTLARTTTEVRTIAKLSIQVHDSITPIMVGETATYKIRIHNCGTEAAERVAVVGYFSRGIEPTGAEGAINRLKEGEVLFEPVPSIAPGETKTLIIHAQADVPGYHVFRAEVDCPAIGPRSVVEKSTFFFQGNDRNDTVIEMTYPFFER